MAEFQRRGLVHFHAVLRADGPNGSPPPIDAVVLAQACQAAVRSVAVSHPRGTARWGSEVDVQVLDTEARATQVAPYVAKYATKEPAMHPGLLSRIVSATDLESRDLPPHLFNMVMSAWSLGNVPELHSLGLRRHAHHLGYSGHFLTKSRGYSTTFGALRDARVQWNQARNAKGSDPETTTRRLKCGRSWLGQRGRRALRRRPGPPTGRRQEGGRFRVVHPMRVSPLSEGKPPEAVRQEFPRPRR